MGEMATEEIPQPSNDVLRRNRPGSKRSDWSNWPDQEFCNMESIHAAQMLIQQRIRNCRLSIDKILEKPEGADEDVWKYEHLRQFCQELNGLATRLQVECLPTSCPQMTATDQWIFLCAAHKSPKECSAIDYTRVAKTSTETSNGLAVSDIAVSAGRCRHPVATDPVLAIVAIQEAVHVVAVHVAPEMMVAEHFMTNRLIRSMEPRRRRNGVLRWIIFLLAAVGKI